MGRWIIAVTLVWFSVVFVCEAAHKKLLVLIISSDHFPGCPLTFPYRQLQEVWRSYMHQNPEQVEAYFIRANPEQSENFLLKEDVLWVRGEENVMPGILNKTVLAMEYFLPRIEEFEFVLRTNLSSFYVFPKLLRFLEALPKKNCYCASGDGFGSGCGFLLSMNLVTRMVTEKMCLIDRFTENDDTAIGAFLRERGIYLRPAPRIDCLSWKEWENYKYTSSLDSQDAFHYRIKNLHHELRHTEDLRIYSDLLKIYYNIDRNFLSDSL